MGAYIMFLLWPALALIFAFVNYCKKSSKNILWLFCGFYGYNLVISNELMDANRYRDLFLFYRASSSVNLDYVLNVFGTSATRTDFLFPLISYFLSRFTAEPRILFLCLGLIFGFFYSRNIWYIIEKSGRPINPTALTFLVTFSLIAPFWSINGFRFYTAFHIFIFGLLHYFAENKKCYLLISLAAFLVHFSFLFPAAVLLLFILLGKRTKVYSIIFLLSFFFNLTANLEQLAEKRPTNIPVTYERKIKGYTRDRHVEKVKENIAVSSWFVVLRGKFLALSLLLMLLLVFLNLKNLDIDEWFSSLFSFSLLFSSFANFLSPIPSFIRFLMFGFALQLAVLFLFSNHNPQVKFFKPFFAIFFVAAFLYCSVEMRIGAETVGLNTLLTNPFIAPFIEPKVSVLSLFK